MRNTLVDAVEKYRRHQGDLCKHPLATPTFTVSFDEPGEVCRLRAWFWIIRASRLLSHLCPVNREEAAIFDSQMRKPLNHSHQAGLWTFEKDVSYGSEEHAVQLLYEDKNMLLDLKSHMYLNSAYTRALDRHVRYFPLFFYDHMTNISEARNH